MENTEIVKLTTYDLKNAEKRIIEKCIVDNPMLPMFKLSQMLGISERTLYRLVKTYNIDAKIASPTKRKALERAKELLAEAGYDVIQK